MLCSSYGSTSYISLTSKNLIIKRCITMDPITKWIFPRNLRDLWTVWGIESLVLTTFILQTILAICGSRRRYYHRQTPRFAIWLAYLLCAKSATLVLGKLTDVPESAKNLNIQQELRALLAPLIFIQLGGPDTITAFSLEDNQLGPREVLSLIIQVIIVIYILANSWVKSSPISFLYLPLFLAGIIKYGEAAWALKSSLRGSSGFKISEIDEPAVSSLFCKLNRSIPDASLILRAYYRFYCLKPHLENWFYDPFYELCHWMSVDHYSSEDLFRTADSELGFMYDVLYTKAPIIYTKEGCFLRGVSFLSLVLSSCVVPIFCKRYFREYKETVFTYFMMLTTFALEFYQILLLPFSDWAIVRMIKYHENPLVNRMLRVLIDRSKSWRRWSNNLGQFNMLKFCLNDKFSKISRTTPLIRYRGFDMKIRKGWSISHIPEIPKDVKELMIGEMKEVEEQRQQKPFNERGGWALERWHQKPEFKWVKELRSVLIDRAFDKSIIIFHIATDIFYYFEDAKNARIESIMMLSNYMMYLLVERSQVISTNTEEIVFDHALERIRSLLVTNIRKMNEEEAYGLVLNLTQVRCESEAERGAETRVTKDWCLLKDVMKLVNGLRKFSQKEDRWKLIGSVWAEMLCYAASNCDREGHAEHIRKGGEFVTHIWLLLAHKTNKYSSGENDSHVAVDMSD